MKNQAVGMGEIKKSQLRHENKEARTYMKAGD